MNALPKLGKLTANGYRISKGFCSKNGQLAQKFFWLGHEPRKAIEKIIAIEEIAGLLPRQTDGKLVWNDFDLARVQMALADFDPPENLAPNAQASVATPLPSAPVATPVFAPQPVPSRTDHSNLKLHAALDQFAFYFSARNEISVKTKTMIQQRVKSFRDFSIGGTECVISHQAIQTKDRWRRSQRRTLDGQSQQTDRKPVRNVVKSSRPAA